MKAIRIEIPDQAYELTEQFARTHELSVDRLVVISLAQYLSQHVTDSYLEELAEQGRRQEADGLKEFLDAAPDVEPPEYDKL